MQMVTVDAFIMPGVNSCVSQLHTNDQIARDRTGPTTTSTCPGERDTLKVQKVRVPLQQQGNVQISSFSSHSVYVTLQGFRGLKLL